MIFLNASSLPLQIFKVSMAVRSRSGSTLVSCVIFTVQAEEMRDAGPNAANILKPFLSDPHSTPFTHGATCYRLGCTIQSQHSPPPPLKFFYTPLTSCFFSPPYMHESGGQSSSLYFHVKLRKSPNKTKCYEIWHGSSPKGYQE